MLRMLDFVEGVRNHIKFFHKLPFAISVEVGFSVLGSSRKLYIYIYIYIILYIYIYLIKTNKVETLF